MTVAARQTVLVAQNLGADGPEWYQFLNVEFIPDEVIVRSISYRYDGTEPNQGFLTTNLIKDSIIGTYMDGVTHNPNSVFPVKRQVKGQFLFQARSSSTLLDAGDGVLFAILEFVKYQ